MENGSRVNNDTKDVEIILCKDGSSSSSKEVVLKKDGLSYTFDDLCEKKTVGGIVVHKKVATSSSSSSDGRKEKIGFVELLGLVLPTSMLVGAMGSWCLTSEHGYDAVFPSTATTGIALKIAIWLTLLSIAFANHYHYWTSTNNHHHRSHATLSLSLSSPTTTAPVQHNNNNNKSYAQALSSSNALPTTTSTSTTAHKARTVTNNSTKKTSKKKHSNNNKEQIVQVPPSMEDGDSVPFRFIRATKGDIPAAKARWKKTCEWRESMGMDTILQEPHPNLQLIKANYPHYFHLRGKKNEACYYESPPKMKIKTLRDSNITMDDMLRHYVLCCEFMWTIIEPNEEGKSIYVINLDGMGMRDFAGEVVDFVKRASAYTSEHYPERSGTIFVVNVPSWFSIIWNAVKGWVDDVTKQKIKIIKSGNPKAITDALLEKIELHNIPPEYGGTSMPLGQSPEEEVFAHHFSKLNTHNHNHPTTQSSNTPFHHQE